MSKVAISRAIKGLEDTVKRLKTLQACKGVEAVADLLIKNRIEGTAGDERACPLARFIRNGEEIAEELGFTIGVGGDQITVSFDMVITAPKPLEAFVEKFDEQAQEDEDRNDNPEYNEETDEYDKKKELRKTPLALKLRRLNNSNG